MNDLKIDEELTVRKLIEFIDSQLAIRGYTKAIIGLSGGLDSTVLAYITARAILKSNIYALILPYGTQSLPAVLDAKEVVRELGIQPIEHDITPMIDSYFAQFAEVDWIRRGNKMARERMSILYDYSAYLKALVLGTSNKTELLLGYGTLYGDLAGSIQPLGDLYKTQIRAIASYLNIPKRIIDKPPSAGFWSDQTDEKEIGFKYEDVDKLLFVMIDSKKNREELTTIGFSRELIDRVEFMMKRSTFKRRLISIPRISSKNIDKETFTCDAWGV
ncbi:MAG: NAD+ synthase [Actinobacteria bacterium]|nr:NAD+ synthase [Actinomycetota bacterium]